MDRTLVQSSPGEDATMIDRRIARMLDDLLHSLGEILWPEPEPEPRPIPVRVDDRRPRR